MNSSLNDLEVIERITYSEFDFEISKTGLSSLENPNRNVRVHLEAEKKHQIYEFFEGYS